MILALVISGALPAAGTGLPPEKVLLVQVDDFGITSVAGDTVSMDQVARHVQERLFKSYLGTGQMYDRIQLEKIFGGAAPAVMEALIKEIRSGQQKALQQLCLEKFSKTFEKLDAKKQARLQRQFPVLFQAITPQP